MSCFIIIHASLYTYICIVIYISTAVLLLYIQRWYIDGIVECFAGEHIPLAIMASLVLVLCGLLIVFLTVVMKKKSKVATVVS